LASVITVAETGPVSVTHQPPRPFHGEAFKNTIPLADALPAVDGAVTGQPLLGGGGVGVVSAGGGVGIVSAGGGVGIVSAGGGG
jgi:hypothetical protein